MSAEFAFLSAFFAIVSGESAPKAGRARLVTSRAAAIATAAVRGPNFRVIRRSSLPLCVDMNPLRVFVSSVASAGVRKTVAFPARTLSLPWELKTE